MRVSQKEEALPGYNRPSNEPKRSSDIDFSDVFGGPPRRASFQVMQNRYDDDDSWHGDGDEDDEAAMGRSSWSHNPNGKPVFGDESVNRRRYQSEDFFGDIFRGDQSLSSSPRIGGRDPLSPPPGSRFLSPSRPLPPGVEPLESPVQFSLPARLVSSHSSSTSLSRLSGQAFNNRDEYQGGDVFSSYSRSPSYVKASSKGEDLKRAVNVGGTGADSQASNGDHFHFSMHKWASKGVPLVMYVTKRNSLKPKEKSKLGNDALADEIQPEDVSTDRFLSLNVRVVSTAGETKEPDRIVDKSVPAAPKLTRNNNVETEVLKPDPCVNESDPKKYSTMFQFAGDKAASAEVGGNRKQKVVRSKLARSSDADTGRVASSEVGKSKSKESLGFKGDSKRNNLSHQESMGNERSRERVREDKGMTGGSGKVREFVKIFNQEPSSKPSAGVDGQRSGSGRWRNADVSRAESKSTSTLTKKQEKMQGFDAKLNSSPKVEGNDVPSGEIQFDTAKAQETYKSSSMENENVERTMGEAFGANDDVTYDSILIQDLPDIVDKPPESADDQEDIRAYESKILKWSKGKEGNIRALLSTLQYVLWQNSGWRPVPLVDIIEANAVKRSYQRALLCLHPDKLQQKGAAPLHKFIAEKVFDILQEAWDHFNPLGSL